MCKITGNLYSKLSFSVVGTSEILDIKGGNEETVELWVKELRKLIGQTDQKD